MCTIKKIDTAMETGSWNPQGILYTSLQCLFAFKVLRIKYYFVAFRHVVFCENGLQ